jgi:hypothetical protein
LFQTVFESAAAADLFPFAPEEDFEINPLPVFAINLGLAAEVRLPDWVKFDVDVEVVFSVAFAGLLPVAPFAARNVLFTETGLKLVGFFTADEVRPWPFSSSLSLNASDFNASLSDPPLMLTSAEFTRSSTMSEICLFSISSEAALAASPFICGRSEWTCWKFESILMVWAETRSGFQHRRRGGGTGYE